MRTSLFLLLSTPFFVAQASGNDKVNALLASGQPRAGIVFEIIEEEPESLAALLPRVRVLTQQLRVRFPDLPVAVVSHGTEQFALLAKAADGELAPIHAVARGLGDEQIDLHVCGVHASWYGNTPEDFPDYVDVSASGPAQINDYEALGFEVIRLDLDSD